MKLRAVVRLIMMADASESRSRPTVQLESRTQESQNLSIALRHCFMSQYEQCGLIGQASEGRVDVANEGFYLIYTQVGTYHIYISCDLGQPIYGQYV